MAFQIINGNALEELKKLQEESVDCIITSPPYYGLRAYKNAETNWGDWQGQLGLETTYQMYLEHLLMITAELKRVLKKTGTLFWNMGDTYVGGHIGGSIYNKEWYISSTDAIPQIKQGRPQSRVKDIPEKSLMMLPERFAIGMIEQGWTLRNKIIWYKCFGSNVPIYVKSGDKIIRTIVKDLARLPIEKLYLPTLQGWKRILRIEKQPKSELLTIHLRNGFRIEVTPEHRFLVNGIFIEASKLKKGDKLDHANLPNEEGTPLGTYKNGWVVGLWLAEGNYEMEGKSVRFSLNVKENNLAKKLKVWSEKYAGRYREHNYGNNKAVIISGEVPYAIIKHYTSRAGAKYKRLSGNVFNENNKFLEGVLDGFLAGDGCYDAKNDRYRFMITTNRDLIEDLRTICNRLGFFMRNRLRKVTANNKKYRAFQIEIRKRRTGHFNQKDDFEILRIDKTKGNSYEIEIEAPHVFILPDGTLTHNSNGMPSSVRDRFTNKWEYIFFFVKSRKYYFDLDAVRKPLSDPNRMLRGVSGKRLSRQEAIDAYLGNPPKGISKPRPNIKNILLDSKYLRDRSPNGSLAGRIARNIADGKLETFVREAITNVNQYLKDKLKESGLTVKQLAEMTGWKETTIAHFFRADLSGSALPSKEFWDEAKDILKLDEYDKHIKEEYKSVLPSYGTGANPGDVIPYHPKGDPTFGMRLPPQPWQEHAFNPNGANPGDFMNIPTRSHTFAHFAVYPVTLVAPLVKVGCPQGGVVLDPFAGSGTTGVVAEILNRNSILIEISKEYIDIINYRLQPENLEKERDVIMKSGKNGSDDR